MERIQKVVDEHVRHRYPLMVSDLTKPEMKLLIWVLNIDNTEDFLPRLPEEERISQAIATLPQALRKNSMVLRVVSKDRSRARVLCGPHSDLNPFVVHHIFELLDIEVIEHMWKMDRYVRMLEPTIREVIHELQTMRGMWWLPDDEILPKPDNVIYQRNRCEACILARVIDEPMYLQNLRTALLARSKHRRAPRLLAFVEEAMGTHRNLAATLFYMSGQLSFDMKAARKEADDQWRMSKGREEIDALDALADEREKELLEMQRKRMDSKTQEIVIYMDPKSEEGQEILRSEASDSQEDIPSQRLVRHGANVEDIIATYASLTTADPSPVREPIPRYQFNSTECSSSTVTGSDASLPRVRPLSIPKGLTIREKPLPRLPRKPVPCDEPGSPSSATSSGIRKGKTRVSDATGGSPEGIYLPPREGIDWGNVIHQRSPLDMVIEHAEALCRPRSEVVIQYENMRSPQTVRYTASEYEDYPVQEHGDVGSVVSEARKPGEQPGPDETTWSLLLKSGM
ncbi:hypothetical protein BDV59DRAFT_66230 [Aspergillus ambiguus]|uniref:uncharacterized protein n=1 Tax=Aspergillus ambiguus TaxID=176160 RepID=UPI003CCD6A43